MNLIARARRYLSPIVRRSPRSRHDPAEMGTAFGLDAITTMQPESATEAAARMQAPPRTRIEHRQHRRSTF